MLLLPSLVETTALAQAFALCARQGLFVPLFLRGPLGVGKTTFIRELVLALPGSEQAEVSSPSFNILNLYPTTPAVGHFDLYRTEGRAFGADLEEILLSPEYFCLVEWAEYLPQDCLPDAYASLVWSVKNETRSVTMTAQSAAGRAVLDCVCQAIP